MNQLQRLIRERMREKGLNYSQVARRGELSRSTVYKVATTPRFVNTPKIEIIEGLARGLDLPLSVVRRAAAEAAGIYVYEERRDDGTEIFMANYNQLSPEQRKAVLAVVDTFLAEQKDRESHTD